jgi:CRP/FNR family transcriptional regulator, polysaccharide utilization system transcription regulator
MGNASCAECSNRSQSIFQAIKPEMLSECLKNKATTRFSIGDILVRQGEPYKGIFCISSGAVKVIKPNPQSENDLILWIARPGDVLGMDALINSDAYSYTAVAIKPVLACFIPEENFASLLKRNQELALSVMQNLSKKINLIEERIQNITHKTVENRFVEFLVANAPKGKEGETFLDHTIDEVSGLIGTTRYYLDKVIGRLRKKNLVTIHKKRIMLLNAKGLEELIKSE